MKKHKTKIIAGIIIIAALAITFFIIVIIGANFLNNLPALLAVLALFAGLFIFGACMGRRKAQNSEQ